MLPSDEPGSGTVERAAPTEYALSISELAEFVLGAPRETVNLLAGVGGDTLREVIEGIEPGPHIRRALLLRVSEATTTHALVEQFRRR